jgi:hypothetical protein
VRDVRRALSQEERETAAAYLRSPLGIAANAPTKRRLSRAEDEELTRQAYLRYLEQAAPTCLLLNTQQHTSTDASVRATGVHARNPARWLVVNGVSLAILSILFPWAAPLIVLALVVAPDRLMP